MKKILLIMAASFIMFAALPFSAFAHGQPGWQPLSLNEIVNVNPTTYNATKGGSWSFVPGATSYPYGSRLTAQSPGQFVQFTLPESTDIQFTHYLLASSVGRGNVYVDGILHGSFLTNVAGNNNNVDGHYNINGLEAKPHTIRIENVMTTSPNGDGTDDYISIFGLEYKNQLSYKPVENLTETHTYKEVTLNWKNPSTSPIAIIVKKNGEQAASLAKNITTYNDIDLTESTAYEYEIIAKYSETDFSVPTKITVLTDPKPPIGELTGVTASPKEESIILSWIKPTHIDFQQVNIYKDGIKIGQSTGSSYEDLNLTPSTAYSYSLKVLSKQGAESAGVAAVATTLDPSPVGEVTILSAAPSHNQVSFTWNLPNSANLQHVNLYRDGVKIGETSGSEYIDLTAEPETTYEYTMTTTSKYGAESEGVSRTVTTLEVPIPAIVGGGYEKDPLTGNFIYYWDEPTTGKVKILVGGSLYKTVEAADKQITIPKNEMKYTAFGDPAVSLIPVGIDGKEGETVKPPLDGTGSADSIENVKVPFTANDLLGSGVGLLWFIAPILLLVLAFLVVPKLRRMLFSIFTKNRTEEGTRRFNDETSTGKESETKEQRKQREQREYRERKDKTERERREQRERKERAEREKRAAKGKEAIMQIEKAPQVAKEPRAGREKVGRSERQQRQQRERSTRERTTRAERG